MNLFTLKLKHSGTTEEDLKVSYLNSDNKEVAIESQLDFQLALYLFRQRARTGEIITLKLDRPTERSKMARHKKTSSSDVQTQASSIYSSDEGSLRGDQPPEWFTKYMKDVSCILCFQLYFMLPIIFL